MTVYYTLKFYRAAFGDTKYKDIPLIGHSLSGVKEEACEALFARFDDMKTAGKGSKAPHTAALVDEHGHVAARFEVKPVVPGSGTKAFEVPPKLWHDKMVGTPSPTVLESLGDEP
ncbi:hypothetical protein GOA89_32550 [Sinorhizobium meliloti]|nr:hypothetical protein [Sinorhizobium meliloti]MDW9850851.1 hypothetical protein [Sinorhizobium meliloti]MDX0147655.1 hypothetical protein [Sinorhizobium meliloti]MDX0153924.1 hypothetical protein [Sinorhizobium meliloti]MDX0172836.1 hypothetical protein [Sinorhizobium meliloti]